MVAHEAHEAWPGDRAGRTRRVGEVFSAWAGAGRDEGMEAGHRRTAGKVLAALPLRPGQRFLDLGCGNAWAAREAAARGARAWGVDVARAMLAKARRAPGREVGLARAALDALPFPDAAFDVVFSVEAIYYAPRVEDALREAARVLRPGGALHAVVDHYAENAASHDWPRQTGLAMHLLGEQGWAEAFRAAGLEEVATARVRRAEGEGEPWTWTEGSLHIRGTCARNGAVGAA